MMDGISAFLAMGGYGAFVWPAYAVAAAVLIGMLVASLARLRREERTLAALAAGAPRRGRARRGVTGGPEAGAEAAS